MYEYDVITPELVLNLTSGLEEVFILDITHSTADFHDRDIRSGRNESIANLLFNEFCKVWNDLHRPSEEISSPFSQN
jgi:hypothetical protein